MTWAHEIAKNEPQNDDVVEMYLKPTFIIIEILALGLKLMQNLSDLGFDNTLFTQSTNSKTQQHLELFFEFDNNLDSTKKYVSSLSL